MATVTWAAASAPSSAASRSLSSSRARRVNVTARHRSGGRPLPIRCAIACVSTRVLPAPGPATTSSGPPSWVTIACCSGSRAPDEDAADPSDPWSEPRSSARRRFRGTAGRPGNARPGRARLTRTRGAGRTAPRPPAPPGSNSRIVPYTPSYPASRRTSPRRSRPIASATIDGAPRRQVGQRHLAEDGQLGPEPLHQRGDLGGDGLGLGADAGDLAQDLRQLYERGEPGRPGHAVALRPVGQQVDPVLHADRRLLPADRALPAGRPRLRTASSARRTRGGRPGGTCPLRGRTRRCRRSRPRSAAPGKC